jgi:hypothetical protein
LLKPQFLIIGERKCGTSSLYRYLMAHPEVLPGRLKEPQFFTQHPPEYIADHIDEYWQLFPPAESTEDALLQWPELDEQGVLYHEEVRKKRKAGVSYLTGDGSANAFFEAEPALIHRYLPHAKLIVLFREPVARAFSHHRMFQRFQEEGRDLPFRVHDFATDMERELQAFAAGEPTEFLAPGLYLQQLKKWEQVYPRSQFRVYFTEVLNDPQGRAAIMEDVQDYLGLSRHDYGDFLQKRFNQAPPAEIPSGIREKLQAFYQPYNLALAQHLNVPLPWGEG